MQTFKQFLEGTLESLPVELFLKSEHPKLAAELGDEGTANLAQVLVDDESIDDEVFNVASDYFSHRIPRMYQSSSEVEHWIVLKLRGEARRFGAM